MEKLKLEMNCALVKRQYVRKDGTKGYSLEVYIPSIQQSVRVLTYKDDNRGYYLLDASAQYIGQNTAYNVANGIIKEPVVDEPKKEGK